MGGGVRLAMASHLTDLLQFWFEGKKPISVNGYLNPITKERKDGRGKMRKVYASTLCTAQINFVDEMSAIFTINAGSYMESRFDIRVFGDKGELTFSLQDKLHLYLREEVGKKKLVEVEGVFDDEKENKVSIFSGSFRYFAPILVSAIKTGKRNKLIDAATFADAAYNLKILDAIQKSANTGETIKLNKFKQNKYV